MRRISAASSCRLASEGHECIYVNKNRCNLITRSSQGLFLFFVFFSFNFLWCCWGNGGINSLLRNWNLCLPCFGYQRVQTCNLTISNPNKKKAIRNCWRIPKVGNICRLCWLRSTIALRQNKKNYFEQWHFSSVSPANKPLDGYEAKLKQEKEIGHRKWNRKKCLNHHVKSQISFKILEFRVSTTESFSADSYLAF